MKLTLKVRTKLILSFTLIAIISAIIGYTGVYIMQEVKKQMHITKNSVKVMRAITNGQKNAYRYKFNNKNENFESSIQFIDTAILFAKKNKAMYDWGENIERADKIIKAGEDFKTILTKYSDHKTKLLNSETTDISMLKTTWDECEALIDVMLVNTDGMSSGVLVVINYAVNTGIKIIAIGVIFTVVLILLLTFILTRNITRQLGGEPYEIAEIAEKISDGQLDFEISQTQNHHGVYASMISMRKKLSDIVEKINATAHSVLEASEQITSDSDQVSQGAINQVSSIKEVSSSIISMNNSLLATNTNASDSEKIALNTVKKVRNDYAQAEEVLASLSELGTKLSIINDIAQQTNILSINAAVEAARAAEHGKGFAVVATEIGRLANQSGTAAADFSKESDRIATTTVKQLSEVVPDIEEIVKRIQEIAKSAAEQQIESNSVNQAVANLSHLAEQNNSYAQEMRSKASKLIDQAKNLETVIGYFKLS